MGLTVWHEVLYGTFELTSERGTSRRIRRSTSYLVRVDVTRLVKANDCKRDVGVS